MRTSAFLPALLIAAAANAQTVNSQVNGLTLTNGLTSLSDTSALYSGPNKSVGITYLTDNDTTTYSFNIGMSGGSIQGTFGGTISSSATGVYIVGEASSGPWNQNTPTLYNGPSFSVQLLLTGGLTSSRTYGDADFQITSQTIGAVSGYQGWNGEVWLNYDGTQYSETMYYSYLYIPFSDFSATYNQVVGIKLGNFTSQYPDVAYIGVGYNGTYNGGPVPEPSTYGLALGGLALAVVAARRRAKRA